MNAKNLINYSNVSILLSGNNNSIRKDQIPNKYKLDVNRLEKLINDWIKYKRSDLDKFIQNLENAEISGKECIIKTELDDLSFDFEYSLDWDKVHGMPSISHIEYFNVTIRDKDGLNEIILILEETSFDTEFCEYLISNLI